MHILIPDNKFLWLSFNKYQNKINIDLKTINSKNFIILNFRAIILKMQLKKEKVIKTDEI